MAHIRFLGFQHSKLFRDDAFPDGIETGHEGYCEDEHAEMLVRSYPDSFVHAAMPSPSRSP